MTKAFNSDELKASDTEYSSENSEVDVNSEIFNDKLWLQNRSTPWEEVIETWKRTFKLRRVPMHVTVVAFIKEWPILNQINSTSLVSNSNFCKE